MADELLLAIETSGLLGSVGLALGGRTFSGQPLDGPVLDGQTLGGPVLDGQTLGGPVFGGQVLGVRHLSADRRHTSELLPTIRDLLRDNGRRPANVDVFAYSCGPGSFTGLRVAATVGRMLQSAVGCRVVAVPTLEVIARNALAHPDCPTRIVALLDARRGQVYAAAYERVADDELRPLTEAGLYEPAALLGTIVPPFWIVGDGVGQHVEACAASEGDVLDELYWPPSVEHVLAIGWRMALEGRVCQPEEIVPLYLRPPECEEVYEKRRAEARRRRGE